MQVCICLAKISLLDGARTRKSTNAINIFVPISPAFKNAFVPMTKTTCKAVHAMPEREKRQKEVCSRSLALSHALALSRSRTLALWRSRFGENFRSLHSNSAGGLLCCPLSLYYSPIPALIATARLSTGYSSGLGYTARSSLDCLQKRAGVQARYIILW